LNISGGRIDPRYSIGLRLLLQNPYHPIGSDGERVQGGAARGQAEGIEGIRARSEPGNLVVDEKPDASIGRVGNGDPGTFGLFPVLIP